MTSQQAAPDKKATQIVSALPLAFTTRHNATAAPTHTGANRIAIIVLHHLGTGEVLGFRRGGSRDEWARRLENPICRGIPRHGISVVPDYPRDWHSSSFVAPSSVAKGGNHRSELGNNMAAREKISSRRRRTRMRWKGRPALRCMVRSGGFEHFARNAGSRAGRAGRALEQRAIEVLWFSEAGWRKAIGFAPEDTI